MPWWLAGVSLMMSVFSVYTFTGAASLTYRAPGVAFTSYLTNGLGYLFGYLFLASKWRRTRSTTVFSYLTERFGIGGVFPVRDYAAGAGQVYFGGDGL